MGTSEQAQAAVDAARSLLGASTSLGLAPADDIVELLARTAELTRLVEAQQVLIAAQVAERSKGPDDESLCRRLGHRSAKSALTSAFGCRGRQAGDLLAMAAATTATIGLSGVTIPVRYPRVAEALAAGELSLPQAQAIVQTLEPAAPRADADDLAWAESALVDAAVEPDAPLVPELLVVQARAYAAVLDPDGVLPDAERQRAMRSLRIGRRTDGMWQITMVCPAEQGAAFKALLDAYTGPRVQVAFREDDDDDGATRAAEAANSAAGGPGPEGAEVSVDDRTPEQIRHDVLVGLVQAHAASGDAPTVGGEPPVLVYTGTIEAYAAYLRGDPQRDRRLTIEHTGDLVPMEHAARLLCDARVQVAVRDDCGHVLQLGRAQRLFSPAQRRALALRDRGCRAPGCQMPAAWCEAHHIVPWRSDGPTDTDNGILLCIYHHHEVHAGRLLVEPAGPNPGQWRVVSQLRSLRSSGARGMQRLASRAALVSGAAPSLASVAAPSLASGTELSLASGTEPSLASDAAPTLAVRVRDRHRASRRPATAQPGPARLGPNGGAQRTAEHHLRQLLARRGGRRPTTARVDLPPPPLLHLRR
ncbi:HNH endonuclease signature motif containing protein [Agrococcus sp. ARC_14]|uniref:HNH endonuclease signature motif containing protein n=1 Tax=Agrococcus sp. ARC_14 TaxID=2919927 RepID=UPI001F06E1EF|nr:HNH endonuclease signature motif containing protein [Agrococcus sp. ARC_14]MCH1883354.1 HNH endonuclease [Agrococcus sp. ARC_14]